MPKFDICVTRSCTESCVVTVSAKTKASAVEKVYSSDMHALEYKFDVGSGDDPYISWSGKADK